MWFDENTKCFPFGMLDDGIVWFCPLNGQLTVLAFQKYLVLTVSPLRTKCRLFF
jgi:hypothetical protein